MKRKISVQEVAYHRNGIGGEGFHVVTFDSGLHELVGVVFEGEGRVAVFDRRRLGVGTIAFGDNSWRGDQFEVALRRAIKKENGL